MPTSVVQNIEGDQDMTQHTSRRTILRLFGLAAGMLALAACGGAATPEGPPTATPPPAGSGGEVTLTIESIPAGSRFNTEKLEAPGGSKITLTFSNKSDASTLYNWVLVKKGAILRVANRGLEAGEAAGYLQEGDPDVIAATKLIKGGESDTIVFDAPPPGVYSFLTTSPGMQAIMKGELTVK
jgi:azurin